MCPWLVQFDCELVPSESVEETFVRLFSWMEFIFPALIIPVRCNVKDEKFKKILVFVWWETWVVLRLAEVW